jgi:hypothetical protein
MPTSFPLCGWQDGVASPLLVRCEPGRSLRAVRSALKSTIGEPPSPIRARGRGSAAAVRARPRERIRSFDRRGSLGCLAVRASTRQPSKAVVSTPLSTLLRRPAGYAAPVSISPPRPLLPRPNRGVEAIVGRQRAPRAGLLSCPGRRRGRRARCRRADPGIAERTQSATFAFHHNDLGPNQRPPGRPGRTSTSPEQSRLATPPRRSAPWGRSTLHPGAEPRRRRGGAAGRRIVARAPVGVVRERPAR